MVCLCCVRVCVCCVCCVSFCIVCFIQLLCFYCLQTHIAVGKALAPLRDQGLLRVLFIIIIVVCCFILFIIIVNCSYCLLVQVF